MSLGVGVALASGACVGDEPMPPPGAEPCTIPIPGAELTLERTKGAPSTATLSLPALTSLCLVIDTNAASASVAFDDEDLMAPSEFKNHLQVRKIELGGLPVQRHVISAKLAGKPDEHYIKIKAFYRSGGLTTGSFASNADEAILLAQAYIQQHSEGSLFEGWRGGRAVRATPLATRDGGVTAFEVDVEDAEGGEAGYIVLESDELRPLLGSAATEGRSLTEELRGQYEAVYGEPPPADGAAYEFLWFGSSIMALEATLPDRSKRSVQTCDGCGASFNSHDRPAVPHGDLGLSPEQWIAQRRKDVREMLDLVREASVGRARQAFVCPGDGYNAGDYCPSIDNDQILTAEVPGGRDAFTYYYQKNRSDWPSADEGAPSTCYAGCTPVAALTVLDYWDRRGYDYLIPDSHGVESSAESDEDVATIKKLRAALKTSCEKFEGIDDPENNQGSTKTASVLNLETFINESARDYAGHDDVVDVGWQVSQQECPHPQWRFKVIREEIRRGRPAIVHYVANWRSGPVCRNVVDYMESRHSAVVYGYWDDGDETRYDDLLAVRTGWRAPPNPTWRLEPTVGTGETFITSIRPGCSPGNEPPLCKTFTDLPASHWGYTAAESLSCMCVMQGYQDGSFGISNDVTKAEFIKIAMRLAFERLDLEGERRAVPAIRVDKTHWASAYIAEAHDRGLLDELLALDGSLQPDQPITRAEAAYLLVRAGSSSPEAHFKQMDATFGCLSGSRRSPYADLDPTTHAQFYRYILAATNRCVFRGYEQDGTFMPDSPISRIEAAKAACKARFGFDSEKCADPPETCTPQFADCD
ncbi:S-layer homology domain-containing protein [Sorangium sp. So ce542]|uniref:S-layer homology domain-containing protein n=1 Tax=Sorangium sp. So ce542 TaxID=3133316 RepID=UPI003F64504E